MIRRPKNHTRSIEFQDESADERWRARNAKRTGAVKTPEIPRSSRLQLFFIGQVGACSPSSSESVGIDPVEFQVGVEEIYSTDTEVCFQDINKVPPGNLRGCVVNSSREAAHETDRSSESQLISR